MATGSINIDDLDHGDKEALQHALEFSRPSDRLSYLEAGYWAQTEEAKKGATLYYGSFDLEKFYPSVQSTTIVRSLDEHLSGFVNDDAFRRLVDQMLSFEVDSRGLSESLSAAVDPITSDGAFTGLPTGLMVAGFLSNVALISIDKDVDSEIHRTRNFAQFRFVDDHAILAFSFEALVQQLHRYTGLLERHSPGVRIAPDKYEPPGLAELVDSRSNPIPSEKIRSISLESEIDGRRPKKLLTRTLAQVSILAGTDFDTLAHEGKLQRLEQLEWLLLASIPEREIRGDTRAAFAAGKIAALAPRLYESNPELVKAVRSRTNQATQSADRALHIAALTTADQREWQSHCAYYFSLLFQAFGEHPDKVRLLIRLIDYCRLTGYDGLARLSGWMEENSTGANYLLKRYLSALTLHTLSKGVIRAACDKLNQTLLHRERQAAHDFVESVIALRATAFIDERGILSHQPEFFQVDALRAFFVGLRSAAAILRNKRDEQGNKLDNLAGRLFSLDWRHGSDAWLNTLKMSIGVWVHWAHTQIGAAIEEPSPVWTEAAASHDPSERLDWNSLRRYPRHLPQSAWRHLRSAPKALADDDAGWLMDAARAAPNSFAEFKRLDRTPFKQVGRFINAQRKNRITLVEWAEYTGHLPENDPRAGEWTALEITRQVLEPSLVAFGSPEWLDKLHPENILISKRWLERDPWPLPESVAFSWESWRRLVRSDDNDVHLLQMRLDDYRLHSTSHDEIPHIARLKCLGQILWGLLRRSFQYPSVWNIRGEERAIVEVLRNELETLRISSATLAILEACLAPRSRETLLFSRFPEFFGTSEANDTLLDPPLLRTLNDLQLVIGIAQEVLQTRQITVLNHHPRQLIPVSVGQIAKSSFAQAPNSENEIDH